ncbi:MAG: hypothetical protein JWN56_2602 [Sphingobacteriales bacterium]|nr:hypothetical protein [Sphingobacteriales bacterium]
MKNFYIYSQYLLLLILLSGITSCKDSGPKTKKVHYKTSVLTKVSALRAENVGSYPAMQISIPGKIYVYNDYLFINEVGQGIHVVDNKNPSYPRIINFIKIPGNMDLAVNSNFLYADSYVDLLTFDISDPLTIKLQKRNNDVFPGYYVDQAKETIVTYKDTVVTVSSENEGWMEDRAGSPFINFLGAAVTDSKSYGQGGSMARFTLMNDYLYTVDHSSLGVFNVSAPSNPTFVSNKQIGWGIETIFPYEDKLFIGSTRGMHIYNAKNPGSPEYISTYAHFTSCDPVIVVGKYAYVTLRTGNFCQQGVNQLDILNVEDILHPTLVKTFPMQNPHGLGISGNYLYLAEGEFGLKSFSITDPLKVGNIKVQQITGFHAFDIIPASKSLIVTGDNGIFQFNYSNPRVIKQISKLQIVPASN